MKWELLNGFENKDTDLSDDTVLTLVSLQNRKCKVRYRVISGSSHWCAGPKNWSQEPNLEN